MREYICSPAIKTTISFQQAIMPDPPISGAASTPQFIENSWAAPAGELIEKKKAVVPERGSLCRWRAANHRAFESSPHLQALQPSGLRREGRTSATPLWWNHHQTFGLLQPPSSKRFSDAYFRPRHRSSFTADMGFKSHPKPHGNKCTSPVMGYV